MTVDDQYEFIERQFLLPSIRALALTYCVPTSKLYDMVISCELPFSDYDRAEEARKSFKRFSSIIGRLSLDGSVNKSREKGRDKQEKLFVPTVFSKELPDLMVLEYNTFARDIGAAVIPVEYRKLLSVRKNECYIDGRKETAFAIPEAVALAILYLSHCRRAVSKLNTPIITENERKRAQSRFKLIKNWFMSEQLYNVVVRMVFELSQEWCINAHKMMEFEYTREYRLPDRFNCTKDIRHAVCHHYISDIENIDKSMWSESKVDRFDRQNQELSYLQYYLCCICPLAEWIITGFVPNNIPAEKHELEEIDLQTYIGKDLRVLGIDYLVALKTARAIEGYLQNMFCSVKYLLSCLKETECLGGIQFA